MDSKISNNFFRLLQKDKANISKIIQAKLTPSHCRNLFESRKENLLLVIIIKFFEKYGTSITQEELGAYLSSNTNLSKSDKTDIFFLYHSCNLDSGTDNMQFIIDEIKKDYTGRRLKEIAPLVSSTTADPLEILGETNKKLQELDVINREDIFDSEIADSINIRKEEYDSEEVNGVKSLLTGFQTFDNVTGGLRDGKLYLIAAPKKTGKSIFFLNLAYNVQQAGFNVLLITLENDMKQTQLRYDSRDSGLAMRKIQSRSLSQEEKDQYYKALDAQKSKKGKLYICDIREMCNTALLEAKYRELDATYHFDLIIVDYMQLMIPNYMHKESWLNQSDIARDLRYFARKINKPVFSALQVNAEGLKEAKKGGKTSELDSTHISMSKAIANHVDLMLGMVPLNNDDKDSKGTWDVKLNTMEVRDSQSFQFLARINGHLMTMEEIPYILTDPEDPATTPGTSVTRVEDSLVSESVFDTLGGEPGGQ